MSSPSLQVCRSNRRLALHIYLLPGVVEGLNYVVCSPASLDVRQARGRRRAITAYRHSIRCASLGLKEVGRPHLDVLEYHFDKIIDFKRLPN